MKQLKPVFILLLVSITAVAGSYKWKDVNGVTHYSDRKPLNVVNPDTVPAKIFKKPKKKIKVDFYKKLVIRNPLHNEEVLAIGGNLQVITEIRPALANGDYLQLYLDEKLVGDRLKSPLVLLRDLKPGKHTLQSRVIDKTGEVLKSSQNISFNVKKES